MKQFTITTIISWYFCLVVVLCSSSHHAVVTAQTCAFQKANTDEACGVLLETVDPTKNCDCYDFCDGSLSACLDADDRTMNFFSCPSGDEVKGCTDDQRLPQQESRLEEEGGEGEEVDTTSSSLLPLDDEDEVNEVDPDNSDSDEEDAPEEEEEIVYDYTDCKVQYNNTPENCDALLEAGHHTKTVVCDCYNFCNGRLTACLNFGEERGHNCEKKETDFKVEGCSAGPKTNLSEIFIDQLAPEDDESSGRRVGGLLLIGTTTVMTTLLMLLLQ